MRKYFIQKRGYYYRPDNCGYTDRPILAGLYTEAEAIATTHPNGDDGPRDGMRYFHESECRDADYLAFKEQRDRIEELEAQLAKVTAERDALSEELNEQIKIRVQENTRAETYRATIPVAYQMGLEAGADRLLETVKPEYGYHRDYRKAIRALTPPADLVERVLKTKETDT